MSDCDCHRHRSAYDDHIAEMVRLGGAHECASDCPQPRRHREAWLTGIERAGLQPLVEKFRVLGPEDLPDPNEPSIKRELLKLRGEVDEDGMVTFYPEVGE